MWAIKRVFLYFSSNLVYTAQSKEVIFFFHLKHGHWHHNSRYTTFFFFKAAILVKCTNTKQISFLPPGGPCKFHISHSFSSQRSIRAWYPMRLSSAVHQICLQEEKKRYFNTNVYTRFGFSPSLHYTDEHKELRGLSEYSTWTSKSTNTTRGHETSEWSCLLGIDAKQVVQGFFLDQDKTRLTVLMITQLAVTFVGAHRNH